MGCHQPFLHPTVSGHHCQLFGGCHCKCRLLINGYLDVCSFGIKRKMLSKTVDDLVTLGDGIFHHLSMPISAQVRCQRLQQSTRGT